MADLCRQLRSVMHSLKSTGVCSWYDLVCVMDNDGEYILVNYKGTKYTNVYDDIPAPLLRHRIHIKLWSKYLKFASNLRKRREKRELKVRS